MPRKHQHFKRASTVNKTGRDTKLTPELTDKMCEYLLKGVYMETAAALCGICRNTFLNWLKRGSRDEEGIYYDFKLKAEAAMAQAELSDVTAIDDAVKDGDWKASAWRLERKAPKRWGKREVLKVESDNDKNSSFDGDNIHKLICDIINETDKKPSGQNSDEEE